MKLSFPLVLITAAVLSACASQKANDAPAPQPAATSATSGAPVAKVKEGSAEGEIIGTIRPGSKFAKLRIGMDVQKVQSLIKIPDEMHRYESGKRWIPFYFGDDAQRVQTYYEGEGCLTYTGGGVFGGTGGQLIKIEVDTTSGCLHQ
ncbi:hypothetical protein RCH09_000580 [Actimicrobium sp. GrIS 1.19]|uniref:hypothetical protein n=1 Tax=Actimicrobium sp. GrIS 1.19 TaxID=3071708 RepID=UPI002E05BEA6|nr:hypothetical protein [Actimicrobium sp. GrIS 1.19]